jgi:hypothetical protein
MEMPKEVEIEVEAKEIRIEVNELKVVSGNTASSTMIYINGKPACGIKQFNFYVCGEGDQIPQITMTVYPEHFEEYESCRAKDEEIEAVEEPRPESVPSKEGEQQTP